MSKRKLGLIFVQMCLYFRNALQKIQDDGFITKGIRHIAKSVACAGKGMESGRGGTVFINIMAHFAGDKPIIFPVDQQNWHLCVANCLACRGSV